MLAEDNIKAKLSELEKKRTQSAIFGKEMLRFALEEIEKERLMEIASKLSFLVCNSCGKTVSTGFFPVPTDTPDKGIIIRAWVECPECIEKKSKNETLS